MADTLTNAGVDNISHYQKIHNWAKPNERQIFLLTAGNLATSQSVVSLLSEEVDDDANENIMDIPSMFQAAKLEGEGQEASSKFDVTMILGGQIAGGDMRLFLIYPEGNFIEVSQEQPFFQIGETKYGKPILVRAYDKAMSYEEAIKLLMVSFDSTIKANLSVGLPLDICIYEKDSFAVSYSERINEDNQYFRKLSNLWGARLKDAVLDLPNFSLTNE
jgi:putative proteasome-type protease